MAAETQLLNERDVGDFIGYEPAAEADEPQEADVHRGGTSAQLFLCGASSTLSVLSRRQPMRKL